MLRSLSVYPALVAPAILAAAPVCACEDEHPPVVTQPVERFSLRDSAGRNVLELAFDPRGLTGLVLADDPRGQWLRREVWHYREWQWWKGHPWGDSCRPRYWTMAQFDAEQRESPHARIAFRIDGFDTYQQFLMPSLVTRDMAQWDVVVTIRNVSGGDVEEYGQFFACYTRLNRDRSFWFWDEGGDLVQFADRGVEHLDGYVVHPQAYFLANGAIPHCPRGGGKVVGTWHRPVMVSQASAGGWRSVIMLEEQYSASLAHGIRGGAMDYILFPGPDQRQFANGAAFSAHIRHVMIKSPELPSAPQLRRLWRDFVAAHDETHRRAQRLEARTSPGE